MGCRAKWIGKEKCRACFRVNRFNQRWVMQTYSHSDFSWIKESVIHFFSPNGLLTVITLILLSVFIFSSMGVERRMTNEAGATYQQSMRSPILDSGR